MGNTFSIEEMEPLLVGIWSKGLLPSHRKALRQAQDKLRAGSTTVSLSIPSPFAAHGDLRAMVSGLELGTGWRVGGDSSHTPPQPAPCYYAFS